MTKVEKCPNPIPCFDLLSFSDFDIPLFEVTFPNGEMRNMILGKHQFRNRQFIGRLEGERHACIAVTLHEEGDTFYWSFTILYNDALEDTMFLWYPQTGVTEVIEEPFTNPNETDVTDPIVDLNIETPGPAVAEARRKRQLQEDPVPTTGKLQIKVGYDTTMLNDRFDGNHEKIVEYWNLAEPHIQVRYCAQENEFQNRNLGSRIKLERINFDDVDLKHYDVEIRADIPQNMTAMNKYTGRDLGTADLMVYMAYDPNGESPVFTGVIGRAHLQSVCKQKTKQRDQAHTICEWHKHASRFASLVAHEIAHTLGIFHDFDERNGGDDSKGSNPNCELPNSIMSNNQAREVWSSCSVKNFKTFYNSVQQDWCLDRDFGSDPCLGETSPPKKTPRIQILGPKFIDGHAVPGKVIINEDVEPNPLLTETVFEGAISDIYEDQKTAHSSGNVIIF
jgi:hypothetical protein